MATDPALARICYEAAAVAGVARRDIQLGLIAPGSDESSAGSL
jgi:hypothetical protein